MANGGWRIIRPISRMILRILYVSVGLNDLSIDRVLVYNLSLIISLRSVIRNVLEPVLPYDYPLLLTCIYLRVTNL